MLLHLQEVFLFHKPHFKKTRVQQNTECQHTQFFFVHTVKNHNPAKLSDLVGHLGTHIRNDESLICPHENCNRTYQCVFILRLVDSCQSYGPFSPRFLCRLTAFQRLQQLYKSR